jgi:voltage-dependent anion channel protein 2
LAGASAGYDVQKAALTSYSAAVGYSVPTYTASITATNNLSVFSAGYYHKVNSQVEAGAKATWDSKSGGPVGLEVASKYRFDSLSFAKVGISNTNIKTLFIDTSDLGQNQRPWRRSHLLQRSLPPRCHLRHRRLL